MKAALPPSLLSRRAWGWVLIGVAFAAASIFLASRWLEVVDETEWVGVKGEAATNPYLALERFLVVKGASTLAATKANELDQQLSRADVGVLLLGANRLPTMTPERIASIAAWVEQGGHLIVEAERPGLGDPLLSRWGVERKPLVLRGGKYTEADTSRDAVPPAEDTPSTTTNEEGELQPAQDHAVQPRSKRPNPFTAGQYISPRAAAARIQLVDGTAFNAIFYAYQNIAAVPSEPSAGLANQTRYPVTISRDQLGGRIAELSVGVGLGRGRVTVISNFDFLQWKELGKADHAELIWHLSAPRSERRPTVLLMLRPTSVQLGVWLVEHAWMVLLTSLVLLCVWIWHVVPRFGTLLPSVLAPRRSLREHMRAAGGWFASRSDWTSLVTPVRVRFWTRLAQRHPRTTLMSQYERIEYASRLCSVTIDEAARLLTSNIASRRECLYAIKWLIRITIRLDGEKQLPRQSRPH